MPGLANTLFSNDVKQLERIEKLIFTGYIDSAEIRILKEIDEPGTSISVKTDLYTQCGSLYKIRGDMEQALHYWEKSNELRKQLYPAGDYRLAWNYALLSNYHYEKINTLQANAYADSCRALIHNLNTAQQLEIEIYRIWNMLAQSEKQQAAHYKYDYKDWCLLYDRVWKQYEHSLEFQLAHSTPRHHLAKTYHLLGNAYQDMIPRAYGNPGKEKYGDQIFATAHQYYDKALEIWKALYGEDHYQAALTHFVQAMTYWSVPLERHPDKYTASITHFEKALSAWGVSDTVNKKILQSIPNKMDLLMCLKVYSESLISGFHDTENREYFNRLIELNGYAISLWEIIYEEFTSGHTNQFLASYHIIPYNHTYYIGLEKKRLGMDYSLEKMFDANQRLKYFDLTRHSVKDTLGGTQLNIQQIQQQLHPGECFLDLFLFDREENATMAIFPDTVLLKSKPGVIRVRIKKLNESIINPDYDNYCETSQHIYADLFGNIDFNGVNKLYICPHGETNNIPFDALLCSDKGIDSKDYRKLDYLLNQFEVEYVLSTATFQSKPDMLPFSLAFYAPAAPKHSPYSELPFSRQLAYEISQNGYGTSFTDSVIDIDRLFNTRSSVVHLSTHGLIEPDHSEYSELVLGKSKLKLDEVYQREINAHLVVLNACNSSRGMVFTDDGVHGFSRAFFSAGAKAVMSNLWEVDDKTSNRIMRDFYQNLHDGHSSFSALRQAKLSQLSQAANSDQAAPYYWAGHWLVGQAMVFEPEDASNFNHHWIAGAAGLFLVVGLVLWRGKRWV